MTQPQSVWEKGLVLTGRRQSLTFKWEGENQDSRVSQGITDVKYLVRGEERISYPSVLTTESEKESRQWKVYTC